MSDQNPTDPLPLVIECCESAVEDLKRRGELTDAVELAYRDVINFCKVVRTLREGNGEVYVHVRPRDDPLLPSPAPAPDLRERLHPGIILYNLSLE
jgi:hypothetical protein